MDEELEAAVSSEGDMGEEGHFDIVHPALVAQLGIVVADLAPSALGEVDLDLCAADHAEIFLADVAGGESGIDAHEVLLVDCGLEADAAEVDTSVDPHRKVVALLAHLGTDDAAREEQEGSEEDVSQFVYFLHIGLPAPLGRNFEL